MVVDVIDIRKRIEKIRNEVSEAIVSKHSYSLPDEQLREDVQFSVEDAEMREPPRNCRWKKGLCGNK